VSFVSPFADVDIADVSVYDYVFGDIADADADRVALVDVATGSSLQYGELIRRIDSFAGWLAGRGIGVGDVVALHAPNSAAFAIAFHGILRAGATATTVNTLATADDIAKQLRDSGARMLITATALLGQARRAAAAVDLLDAEVIVLDRLGPGRAPVAGRPNMADLLSGDNPTPQPSFDPATHLAVIPYSSGTTGNPKGVMLTHRNVVANLSQTRALMRSNADEIVLAVMPFFHTYGLAALLNSAMKERARLIIMSAFDFNVFLTSIAKYKCTQTFIAPPILVALAKHSLVDSFDLSSLHTITSAAAPMDEGIGNAVARRLDCRVLQAYGLSELSPASHMMPFDGGLDSVGTVAPLGSCGWTVPNSESKIVNPATGDEIPLPTIGLSEAGELCFKGPNVMAGYLGNAEATAKTIDVDGFLHTGDVARVDAHGCVYIVDRLKDLIKYKGYQVPPAELIPKAFVVRQPGAELSEVEVMNFVARQVAPYKKVRQVEFVGAIPKSTTGKILRRELRTGHSGGSAVSGEVQVR
jgi:acyl-CoA synthetase (AMP-forming)/AMP-acid ligase II